MKYFLSTVLFLWAGICFGQTPTIDSLLVLPVIEVNAAVPRNDDATNTNTLGQEELLARQGHSVADVLQSEGLSFIKSYGQGSIATVSVRGGSAGQMAVFWNGLPIQSPMLGLLDLSMLTLGGQDVLQFEKGGQSTGLGSGAVSGTLQLSQQMPEENLRFQLASSIASFAQQKQSFTISGGGRKWRVRTSLHKNSAENNFPYQLGNDQPLQYMPHARTDQSSIEQVLFWQLHPRHRLQFHYWQQQSDRLIPPTSVQTRSKARQQDSFKRSVIRYTGQSKKAVLEGQLAYFKENILYEDPRILLRAPTGFNSYIAQFSASRILGQNWHHKGGLQLIHTTAEAEAYQAIKTQTQLAVYQLFSRALSKKITLEIGGRLTALQGVNQPVSAFHFKLKSQFARHMKFHLRISRDFRIPTLNDLYWIPGGKPDLETEYALGQELAIVYNRQKRWQYQLNIFNRHVNNWIQWTQSEASGIWTVDNITKVWSRGVEQALSTRFKLGEAIFLPKIKLDWIKSTYQTSIKNPSIEKGESLWYTPEWQVFAQLKVALAEYSMSYTHQWTAATVGINKNLAPYHLGRIEMAYKHTANEHTLHLFGRLTNIWNTTYRVIENRPMPGRAFEVGLTYVWNRH